MENQQRQDQDAPQEFLDTGESGENSPSADSAQASEKGFSRFMFLREFLLLGMSTAVCQASRFLVSLGAMKVVGPTKWGLWNVLNLIIAYNSAIRLGVVSAMNRDVPLLKGRGDFEAAEIVRRVALGSMLVLSLSACAIIAGVALFTTGSELGVPLALMSLLLFCMHLYTYLQVYLRSDRKFTQYSVQQFVFAAILPAVVVPLVLIWHLEGFIFGQALAVLAVCLFIVRLSKHHFRAKLDWRRMARLVKVGFPLMAGGLLFALLTSVDRWVVASFLGLEELGYYSLSIIVVASLIMVPVVITQQIYPRMAETYGKTGSYAALNPWIYRQAYAGVALTVPLVIVVYFAFPAVVERFLPAYAPGITAMRVVLLGLPLLPLAWGIVNCLNTVDRQLYSMAIQGGAVALNLVLNILFVKMGWGINGVALGSAITYVAYALACVALWVHFAGSGRQLRRTERA